MIQRKLIETTHEERIRELKSSSYLSTLHVLNSTRVRRKLGVKIYTKTHSPQAPNRVARFQRGGPA